MKSRQQMKQRRKQIAEEMLGMESMRRGTLNEQFLPVAQKGSAEPALRGPYYVLSRKQDGKTRSERVPARDVPRVREDIARHKRFVELCGEFAEITEQMGALQESADTLKKKPSSPLKPAKK